MWSTWSIAASSLATLAVYKLFKRYLRRRSDVVLLLPGPRSNSWLWGCTCEYILGEFGPQMLKWQKEFGMVYRLPAELGDSSLMLTDPVAINFIFADHFTFTRTPSDTEIIRSVLGEGLSWAEGSVHTRQRAAIQPSFNVSVIKGLYPVFYDKVRILIECLHEYNQTPDGEPAPINMVPWINRVAIDIVGVAAFRYDFNTLRDQTNPVAGSFSRLMNESLDRSPAAILQWAIMARLPSSILRNIDRLPTASSKQISDHRKLMTDLARTLVDRSIKEIQDGVFEEGKDIMSQIVLANLNSTPGKGLTEPEVFAQVSTFLAAGEETVATTTIWGLYELCLNPIHQERIRAEVLKAVEEAGLGPTDPIPLAVLEKLEYTHAFLKETLRFHPGLFSSPRSAAKDVVIPLSGPVRLTNGQTITSLPVQKGQDIDCVTTAYNRLEAIWGEDAGVFDPTRWIEGRMGTLKPFPSIYANLMTFIGGPRACPGWRFALMELQILFPELIRNFSFSLPPGVKLRKELAAVPIPVVVEGDVSNVKTVKGMGKQNLPLILTPVAAV